MQTPNYLHTLDNDLVLLKKMKAFLPPLALYPLLPSLSTPMTEPGHVKD